MNSGGGTRDLPHVVLLQLLASVPLEPVVLRPAEVLGVAGVGLTRLPGHPHSLVPAEGDRQLTAPDRHPLHVVPGDTSEGGGGELHQGAGRRVSAPDELDPLHVTVE